MFSSRREYVQPPETRTSFFTILLSAAAGAAAMYYLDPESGRRRREAVKDRAANATLQLQKRAESVVHDAATRTRGAISRANSAISKAKESAENALPGETTGGGDDRTNPSSGNGHA